MIYYVMDIYSEWPTNINNIVVSSSFRAPFGLDQTRFILDKGSIFLPQGSLLTRSDCYHAFVTLRAEVKESTMPLLTQA